MSAEEVIEQIKTLPPDEKAQVIAFVREMRPSEPSSSFDGVRCVDQTTFQACTKKVFERHEDLFRKLAE